MPQLKLQHVVSVSSEDKNFPADNLLKGDGFKKWKAKIGEKTASVILQLAKAETIHQIDIGNENSAFIEVLVGNSTSKGDDDYKVIVIASSFMSPSEARNSQNGNRVRMFGADKLSQAVAGEKWDRIKIVCSQQFNKTVPFGLSFIKCHGTPAPGEEIPEEKPVKLGAFAIKAESSSEGDVLKPGGLFAKKDKPDPVPLQGAAAMRAASKLADDSAAASTSSSSTPTQAPVKRKREEEEKPRLQKQSTSVSSVASRASSTHSVHVPPLKKSKTEPSKPSKEKAFGDLLKDVVFVLSGYQNPERGKIRDKALEMGATYKPDWGKGCTHLICAVKNTPKYNQVKGKGRIVDKDWLKDCYRSKKRQSWRKYRVGDAPTPPASSSESEDDEPPKAPKQKPPTPKGKSPKKDVYAGSTDSGEDTEDELRKIQEKKEQKESKTSEAVSVFDAPTDEDVSNDDDDDGELPELPDFFKRKRFFLYGKWDPADRRIVQRYVIAYNGELLDYMSDKVSHVLTNNAWDDNFEQALSDNPDLHFVKPAWIHACYDKQKLLPHQKYVIVPN